MKAIKFFTLAMAVASLFGCSKENKPEISVENTTKTVSVTLESLATKSVDTPISTGSKTALKDGALLFFSSTGVRVHTVVLTSTEGVQVIPNVPTSATQVMLVGNYIASGNGANYNDFAETSLVDTKAKTVNISSLQVNGTGVENVIMTSNAAPITDATDSTPENPKGVAEVTITPIVSRIEIKSIGTKTGVVNQITSFDLLGVFVPNHFATGNMAAVAQGALVKPAVSAFNTTFPNGIFDFNEDGLSKTENEVYAYHTFPAAGVENLPWVVIKVKNVTYNNGVNPNASFDEGKEQYVTVKTYKKKDLTSLTSFEAAKIYSLSAVNFGLDNLVSDPNANPKSVEVTVEITAWEVIEITPDL